MGIIQRARKSGIASPLVVHRLFDKRGRHCKTKAHPTQLTVQWLSTQFKNTRDKLGIGGLHPPSLYETRSLASWLYDQQKRPRKEIQALMAHTEEGTTDMYVEARREVYEEVWAGLSL